LHIIKFQSPAFNFATPGDHFYTFVYNKDFNGFFNAHNVNG